VKKQTQHKRLAGQLGKCVVKEGAVIDTVNSCTWKLRLPYEFTKSYLPIEVFLMALTRRINTFMMGGGGLGATSVLRTIVPP